MVHHMLARVGSRERVPELIEEVKSKKEKLYGFGHRVYETADPRAEFVKKLVDESVADGYKRKKGEGGGNAAVVVEIAEEIERVASADEWFQQRKIGMNVDLYGSFVYTNMGFPAGIIFPLTAIARAQGYVARWREFMCEYFLFPLLSPLPFLFFVCCISHEEDYHVVCMLFSTRFLTLFYYFRSDGSSHLATAAGLHGL